jgi:hypothetical protein
MSALANLLAESLSSNFSKIFVSPVLSSYQDISALFHVVNNVLVCALPSLLCKVKFFFLILFARYGTAFLIPSAKYIAISAFPNSLCKVLFYRFFASLGKVLFFRFFWLLARYWFIGSTCLFARYLFIGSSCLFAT